jgi:glucose-induced degradation protein 8
MTDSRTNFSRQILDRDPSLHFALLRLQLVELIRSCTSSPGGDITPALNFARAQLAPRASSNHTFLEELEKTMALLVFPHDSLEPDLAAILDPSLRRAVADDVNHAMLERQARRSEAAILRLVKVRAWAENAMRQTGGSMPESMELGLNEDESAQSPVTVF